MTIENDFLPFAVGADANVLAQSSYAALTTLLQNGFSSGIAQSAQLNKVWRQSSIMAAVIASFIVQETGQPAIDDGTTATLLTNLTAAINALIQSGSATYAIDTSATANQIVAALSPAPGALVDNMRVTVKVANSNTGATTLNLNGLGAEPVLGLYGVALQGGELTAGGMAEFRWSAGVSSWVLVWAQDGALQIPPAVNSEQAAQFSQVGSFNGQMTVSGTATLTSAAFGKYIAPPTGSAGGFTITLPAAAGNAGKALAIFNSSSGNITLSAGNFNTSYGSGTSIVLPPNSTAVLVCDATSYNGIGGSAGAGSTPRGTSSSGIGQWTTMTIVLGSSGTVTLPAGGTWQWWCAINGGTAGAIGISAGGTTVVGPTNITSSVGFCWRIA